MSENDNMVEYELGVQPAAQRDEALLGSGESAALSSVARQVVHIDDFEPAVALPHNEQDAYKRRFVTLFQEPGAARLGGLGRVVPVGNLWGEVFALKVLKAPAEQQALTDRQIATLESNFRSEYRLQCALSGLKGFPRVYGFGTVDGASAIVMEWIEGVTLDKALRTLAVDDSNHMSPLTAARIGRDVFDLLMRMGLVEGGLAHCDISLLNIMVRTDRMSLVDQVDEGVFDLCLIDFGSAASVDVTKGRAATTRGVTWEFAAPELLRNAESPHDEGATAAELSAADVFAAASVVWYMATGSMPFDLSRCTCAQDVARLKAGCPHLAWLTAHDCADIASVLVREPEVAVAVRQAAADFSPMPEPEQVSRALCNVDTALGAVLSACLHPDPAKRPKAQEVRDALGSFSFHYAENVGRALRGEPAVPLVPGSLADGYGANAQRRRTVVRAAGKALSAAVGLAALVCTAVLVGAMPAPFSTATMLQGASAGIAALVGLLLPFAGAAAIRARARGKRGLVRAGAGALAGGLIALCFGVGATPATQQCASLLGAACLVSAAASWCFFAMDFIVPGPSAAADGPAKAGSRACQLEAPRSTMLQEAPASDRVSAPAQPLGDQKASNQVAASGINENSDQCQTPDSAPISDEKEAHGR